MDDIIELTKKLVSFKSTHDNPKGITECMGFVGDFMKSNNISFKKILSNGFSSLLAVPESRVKLLLMTHIDVVKGNDELFKPRQVGSWLYGRGSLDDKYAVALSLILMKKWVSKVGQKQSPLGLLITSDEELGGFEGAKKALKKINADFAIALDGGSLNKIVVKSKGVCKLRLLAAGRSAHSSRPWLGDNAIDNLVKDCGTLKKFFPESSGGWSRTINTSFISGGNSFNQVPDHAEAVFDIRYTENDDINGIIDDVKKSISSEVIVDFIEPVFVNKKNSLIDKILSLFPEVVVAYDHGTSDARFLSENDIPGIVWGADGDESFHKDDERVNVDSVKLLYERIDKLLSFIYGTIT